MALVHPSKTAQKGRNQNKRDQSGKGLSARRVAVDILESVLDQRLLLEEALESEGSAWAALEVRDRAFARHLVSTTLRRRGQIDALVRRCLERRLPAKAARVRHILRLGVCQLLFLDVPAHAVLSTMVDLVKGTALAGFAGLVNAVLRRIEREGRAWVHEQDAPRLNTPDWLWQSWEAAYGADVAHAIALAHLAEAPLDLTLAGRALAGRDDAGSISWHERLNATVLPTGSLRILPAPSQVSVLPGFAEGAWWVQDAAAALPARLLSLTAGQRVADLCAAPGGKTLQLLQTEATVIAVDRSAKRLRRVTDNAARIGRTVTIVADDVARWMPETPLDAVLLDAPCSATGTLRRHPDGLWLKQEGDVAVLAQHQALFLQRAVDMLKVGGTLVYCVCSLQPEEGPDPVEQLLAQNAGVTRYPIRPEEVGGLGCLLTAKGDLRTLPCHLAELGGMDGFFAARLRKISG